VDGLTFEGVYEGGGMPLIQISANNPTGEADSHFRNVKVVSPATGPGSTRRRALINLGGGPRLTPSTPTGVPIYIHDHFGPGRHAKVVSTRAKDLLNDGNKYVESPPLTGNESRVAEVSGIEFPKVLDPVDDLPPASVVTFPTAGAPVKAVDGVLIIRGTTTDNTQTKRVSVNGVPAKNTGFDFHQWEVQLTGVKPGKLKLVTDAEDVSGNHEKTPHELEITVE
jgi:hypothetical protein